MGRVRWSFGNTFAALVMGSVMAICPAQAQEQADAASTLESWSGKVWTAADGGNEQDLIAQLEAIVDANPEHTEWLRDSIEQFKTHIAQREQKRLEEIERANAELDEHLAKGEDAIELSEALRVANELEMLMPSRDEFLAQERIVKLVDMAERAARRAVENRDWLVASELYARLDLLFEHEDRYKSQRDELDRRLTMIRTYTPELFAEMRNQRRIAAGEEPLPAYNPIGDSWQEKFADVRMQTVLQAIGRTYNHVDRVGLEQVLASGIDAVKTMAATAELGSAFEGLSDESRRNAFLAALDEIRQSVVNHDGKLSRRDIYDVAERLIRANTSTVNIPTAALAHEFGNGAMAALDLYSAIIWPDELARFERATTGEFVGVGISIQLDEAQNIKVVTPLEGSPAQRAGIRADDLIKGVDGKSTLGFSLDQAVEVITGPRGTKVTLTIERRKEDGSVETIDFPLIRDVIDLPTVKGWEKIGAGDADWNWFIDPDNGIGYVRLTGFSEKTTAEFDRAIRAMRRDGLNGLVLDLRFNPGGLLDQAVNIASRFVNDGLIVRTEDGNGRTRDRQEARRVPESVDLSDLPVVVLINEGSASASEIVSGAIQAHAEEGKIRALVVGHRSFGKGSVQNVFPIPGDDRTLMKLTTQYYKLRTNHMIHRRPGASEYGINPDLTVEMLPGQEMEALLLRRDADVLPLDEHGNVVQDAERPDPNRLINEGLDLQLEAAVVLLQSQGAPETIAKMSRIGG
ncbi:MAG: PDZ domain-containing protein [Planctomycetota bacterium]|nr:MAG: PDZ domain-containing protein [Planctomycetota bacterium]